MQRLKTTEKKKQQIKSREVKNPTLPLPQIYTHTYTLTHTYVDTQTHMLTLTLTHTLAEGRRKLPLGG